MFSNRGEGLAPIGSGEADVAALDVGADQLDAHALADVEAVEAMDHPLYDRGVEEADPGPRL